MYLLWFWSLLELHSCLRICHPGATFVGHGSFSSFWKSSPSSSKSLFGQRVSSYESYSSLYASDNFGINDMHSFSEDHQIIISHTYQHTNTYIWCNLRIMQVTQDLKQYLILQMNDSINDLYIFILSSRVIFLRVPST